MNKDREQQWLAIMSMARHMITYAEQEQWDELVALYQYRDPLLHGFFEQSDRNQEGDFLAQAIPELMELEQQLMQLCANARDEAARELGKVSLGRKAEAAYNKNR